MYPMKLAPTFKDYLWGGERLVQEFNKKTDLRPIAESWEISTHKDGLSIISNGLYAGKTLREILKANPHFLGAAKELPILAKFIDAHSPLSLQVHPDNEYAYAVEGEQGKNELWYVVEALPGAEIIVGFKAPLEKDEVKQHIINGTLLEKVKSIPVKSGDCFEIPAGLLHGIGEGVLIYEVQQNSNTTYRVYDYQRKDAKGNFRELHINKALDVIDTSLQSVNKGSQEAEESAGYSVLPLTNWAWFSASRLTINGACDFTVSENSYHTLTCLTGALEIQYKGLTCLFIKGDSCFLPAGLGDYSLSGSGVVIQTSL